MGKGDGTFKDETNSRESNGDDIKVGGANAFVDLNNDGKLDLFGLELINNKGTFSNALNIYLNVDGVFTRIEHDITDIGNSIYEVVDYDNDGDMDVFNGSNGIYYYEAIGSL